ncbi:MAG TPA: type II toxin-antitoxin system VapC family toxin [Stellaceae bacterium]|nr:type II toxin-antitoxin system VapC family toxin [Stellaceae bacterium]HEV2302220.1 type II toxin-antitoxin system VapC family toxin [Stellaceae bacterium]
MALYFLDTSALVKLYVQETGTDRLLPLISDQPENRFAVLAISVVEVRSAIRRRQRAEDIDATIADAILKSVRSHMETRFIRQAVNDTVIDAALDLIDRYALRAYDAIQLAGCLVLCTIAAEAFTFVCSDHRLLEAARSEQLKVLDPAA